MPNLANPMPAMSRRPRVRPRAFASALGAAVSVAALAVGGAPASAASPQRTETPIVSTSAQTDVASSLVRLHVPLPASTPPHPEACDWIAYERFRLVDGPTDPTKTDAVAVLQPGILEGATAFDPVARNAIREAKRRGKTIEVWAIDRRANCLEDKVGLEAIEQGQDPSVAIDYYYRGKVIDGQRFAGYRADTRVLGEIGLAQTMEDWNAVITGELPDQAWREQHVVCGGHSLGGMLTEVYASWDFDGNPRTTSDAGYRQCAGFMAFDTTLNAGVTKRAKALTQGILGQLTAGTLRSATRGAVKAIKAGTIPRYIDLLGISPETMNALELVGTRADLAPDGDATPIMQDAPRTAGMRTLYHLAGSASVADWLGSDATLLDLRYTNLALLGQIMDDNGGVYSLVRSSMGFFEGVPLRRNRLGAELELVPGLNLLFKKGSLVLPQRLRNQPIAQWRNYDELGSGESQLGRGITSPDSEVTDAGDFARILHEGPTNLTENFFPMRIVVELSLLAAGDRSGTLSRSVYPSATTRKPRLAVIAGDGLFTQYRGIDPQVIAPGYEHLDVVTAAERQNNGKPEPSSQAFADLIDQATGD